MTILCQHRLFAGAMAGEAGSILIVLIDWFNHAENA
jgi:hypothetical protein